MEVVVARVVQAPSQQASQLVVVSGRVPGMASVTGGLTKAGPCYLLLTGPLSPGPSFPFVYIRSTQYFGMDPLRCNDIWNSNAATPGSSLVFRLRARTPSILPIHIQASNHAHHGVSRNEEKVRRDGQQHPRRARHGAPDNRDQDCQRFGPAGQFTEKTEDGHFIEPKASAH